jgi:hypothetical protein
MLVLVVTETALLTSELKMVYSEALLRAVRLSCQRQIRNSDYACTEDPIHLLNMGRLTLADAGFELHTTEACIVCRVSLASADVDHVPRTTSLGLSSLTAQDSRTTMPWILSPSPPI